MYQLIIFIEVIHCNFKRCHYSIQNTRHIYNLQSFSQQNDQLFSFCTTRLLHNNASKFPNLMNVTRTGGREGTTNLHNKDRTAGTYKGNNNSESRVNKGICYGYTRRQTLNEMIHRNPETVNCISQDNYCYSVQQTNAQLIDETGVNVYR